MASSVLHSLPLLLITAGIALFVASLLITRLARRHRRRMEALLRLAHQEIDPLELPAAAWPQFAEAGWQGLSWKGVWFGQTVSGTQGNPELKAPTTLDFEVGSDEARLQLHFYHTGLLGEKKLFADQLARVFVLLLETRLRARSEALAAALAERARLSLYLQQDMRNLAQWVCWISADLCAATQAEQLLATAERLRENAPLAQERAERLIDAMGQRTAIDQPEMLDLRQAIVQAAQLAGFEPEISGDAQAWIAKSLLARALDTTVDYLLHGSCGNNDTCVIWMSETDDNVQRERLQQALYVLKSNTEYATSLEMNIRSFYKSVKDNVEQRNEIIELKKQIVDLLAELKQHRAVIDASKQPAASIPPKSKPESNRET